VITFKILSVGKNKEEWLETAINLYKDRLKGTATFTFIWAKNDQQLEAFALKEKFLIALDPQGPMLTSEGFAHFLEKQWMEQGATLTFVIGGAEGLPSSIREKAPLLSLSKMTFTHQMARLILVEQIYRALEILKGSGYHK